MNRSGRVGCGILAAVAVLATAVALWQNRPAKALSEAELGNIALNCATIKQSLRQLQHSDSRTRAYLGSAYETIYGRFITPLNQRLEKNGEKNEQLALLQSDFAETQAKFRTGYTAYMRALETLLNTDCKAHPQEFYERLEDTRTHREALNKTTAKLSGLIDQQIQGVESLMKQPEEEASDAGK